MIECQVYHVKSIKQEATTIQGEDPKSLEFQEKPKIEHILFPMQLDNYRDLNATKLWSLSTNMLNIIFHHHPFFCLFYCTIYFS